MIRLDVRGKRRIEYRSKGFKIVSIVTVRRISQTFFFTLFVWFCIVSTVGERFSQLRAWPVNWFLQLDPLAAIGTILTEHSLYRPLLWALVTVSLTIVLGRFFCSWVCPFGSLHHFVAYLAHRKRTTAERIELNKYRRAQCVKYILLILFLAMAAFPSVAATLQTGLLDPISLITRSFNLVLLPIIDRVAQIASATPRFYDVAWLTMIVFFAAVLLNLAIPRFYCRFICPLGALLGILARFAVWRIGKNQSDCINCRLCEKSCEGGCQPAEQIRISECVLCFNCRADCKHEMISYQTIPSPAGEVTNPDISRRGFVISLACGVFAVPAVRLSNKLGANWHCGVIRPPGALPEEQFLKRCLKCGQCMRICPTNVIQPGCVEGGLENLWTPVLNNRIGSSGCQLNCVACGQICPTAAIRPITIEEKLGLGEFENDGPITIGTAFVDRSRCLPWALGRPCIVCQENCPLSPKAIYTVEYFETVRNGILTAKEVDDRIILTLENNLSPGKFATGDHYCLIGGRRRKILANSEDSVEFYLDEPWEKPPAPGSKFELQVRLQKPYVDVEKCIGCGLCEHECPVSGKRAIRVSAEGESRDPERALLLKN
jgi:polyferredoxin